MKKGLLLRQQVPIDKDRITFNSFSEIDDMWIWLFYMLSRKLNFNSSEIWIWGSGSRKVQYSSNFLEYWYPNFFNAISDAQSRNFEPDFIFSRGGFTQYIPVMQKYVGAFKLYYAAIHKPRINPKTVGDLTDYNLILADSQIQYNQLSESGFEVHKFLKPACEQMFNPVINDNPEYDIVFMSNTPHQKARKGHKFLFEQLSGTNLSLLVIGIIDDEILGYAKQYGINVHFTNEVRRKEIKYLACKAKIGVCCSLQDSCPRVIPEMLAMNIPIVVRKADNLFIWDDYFKDGYAALVEDDKFLDTVRHYVDNYGDLKKDNGVADFYLSNFSLEISSMRLAEDIKKIARQVRPPLA